jgi:hypothetical protein
MCGIRYREAELMPLSILQRLAKRILVIHRAGDGFIMTEACDLYFDAKLTADELRQLARELTELADHPEVMPPDYQN